MAAPTTGYCSQQPDNPGSVLTNFTALINLAHMHADWWTEQNDTDPTKARAYKADGTTRLPIDIFIFDAVAKTGWARVLYSAQWPASGDQTVRIYPPHTSNAAVARSATYGQDNAYASHWKAYWPDGGGADRTSNGNDGTANGGVTFGGVARQVGVGTDYDGGDDYAALADAASLSITGDISIMVWSDPDSVDRSHHIFGGYLGGGNPGYALDPEAGDTIRAFNGTAWAVCTVTNVWSVGGGFFHIGYSNDNTNTKFYVDGAQVGSDVAQGNPNSSANVRAIGAKADGSSQFHDGVLNEVQIHNVALAADWWAHERAQGLNQAAFWNHAGTWAWTAGGIPATRRVMVVA